MEIHGWKGRSPREAARSVSIGEFLFGNITGYRKAKPQKAKRTFFRRNENIKHPSRGNTAKTSEPFSAIRALNNKKTTVLPNRCFIKSIDEGDISTGWW